jgi:ubiquitin carboxyl-terminal hydrolase 10
MPERANAPSQEDTNITPKPQTEVDLVIPSIQSIPSTPSKSVAVLQSSVETDTTPVSVAKSSPSQATPKSHVKPALPIVPVTTKPVDVKQSEQPAQVANPVEVKTDVAEETTEAEVDDALKTESASSPQPSAKTAPKSWADLVRSKAAPAPPSQSTVDGEAAELQLARSKSASLAEVIRSFNVATPSKFAFLEPRGLVNTGNMCYMNSVSLWSIQVCSLLTNLFRFFKLLYFASLSMISLSKWARKLLTALRVKRLCSMQCELNEKFLHFRD